MAGVTCAREWESPHRQCVVPCVILGRVAEDHQIKIIIVIICSKLVVEDHQMHLVLRLHTTEIDLHLQYHLPD